MSTFKRTKVIMSPTKNEKHKGIWLTPTNVLIQGKLNDVGVGMPQHLHLVSDDKIEDGDWCLLFDDFGKLFSHIPQQYQPKKGHVLNNGLRKIIATTDGSLVKLIPDSIIGKAPVCFPQPSQSFIEKYVESYNAGKPIVDVMVEYEEYENSAFKHHIRNDGFYPKINPKDNTITIKKVKDTHTTKEVGVLIQKFMGDYEKNRRSEEPKEMNEFYIDWVEENLFL